MALGVVNANPGRISGVSNYNPGKLGPVVSGGSGYNYNPQSTYNPQRTASYGGGYGGAPAVLSARSGTAGPSMQQIAQRNADIAAANAENTRKDNARRGFGIERGGIESGYRTKVTDNTNSYRGKGQGFTNDLRTGQEGVNSGRANNALNTRRSMGAIATDVRTGLRSGGVALANMNATDSGAADAMARAWAVTGNNQAGVVRNEAQLVTDQLNADQVKLDRQEAQGIASLSNWRSTETNRISNQLYNELQVLENKAVTEGVGGVVDMGYRDRLIAAATQELNDIDNTVRAELGAINGLTPEQVEQQALAMEAAGSGVRNPFAVEETTVQTPESGAPISQIGGPVRRPEDELLAPVPDENLAQPVLR